MAPLLRDTLLEYLEMQHSPICINCLSVAVGADFNSVMTASQDVQIRRRYTTDHDMCPRCRRDTQLVLRPSQRRAD